MSSQPMDRSAPTLPFIKPGGHLKPRAGANVAKETVQL